MKKNNIASFIFCNVMILAVIVLFVPRFGRVAIIVALVLYGLFLLLYFTNKAKQRKNTGINPNDPQHLSLVNCKNAIDEYLKANRSTPFFRFKLNAVLERLDTFESRCVNIKRVITQKFGCTGLSFGKFAAPVEALQNYLVNQATELISRMKMFNETEYNRRIGEFTQAKRIKEAEAYREVEQEYKNFAAQTLDAFDDAILKLDKLTLELSKMGEAEVEKAIQIMHDLDDAISDSRMYR